MDLSVALWIFVPLALIHLAVRRDRPLLLFQVAVDIALVLLPGRLMLRGLHLGPGVPGAIQWGAPTAVAGSPEQSDLPLEFSVWWAEVRRLVAAGDPPWISDRIGGGAPLFANGQTGLPFPLQLPVWVLGPERGSDVMAVWKLELAALGGFLLLRRLRARPAAAAVGALAFGFGLDQLSWLVVPLAWVVAATPWAWWALIGTLRGRRREAALLALGLGGLTGWSVHAESGVFLFLAVALGGGVLAWGRRRRVVRLLAPLLVALPVAAVGALPTLSTIADSAKLAANRRELLYPGAGVDWSLRARMLALMVSPWREGSPAAGTWRLPFPHAAVAVGVGAAAITLLFVAPLRRRHRRVGLAVGVVGAGAVALVFQLPGASQLAARLPVLGVMTWARAGFLVGFAMACGAALGLDAWLARPRRARLAGVAICVAFVAAGLRLSAHQPLRMTDAVVPLPAVLAAAAALPPAVPLLAPALVGVEAVVDGWNVVPGSRDAAAVPALVRTLQDRSAREGGRVLATGAAMPANLPARFGLADLRSVDPLRPLSMAHLHQALGATGMDLPGPVTTPWAGLAGAWNVRWLATPSEGLHGPWAAGWEEVYRDAGGRLYRNRRALPVLRLASRAIASPGDPATGAWEGVNFSATAVVGAPITLGGEGTLTPLEDRPFRHVARVRAAGRVLAVLHVPRAPGWRAFIDGRAAPIVVADLAAMGVVVADGEHEVRWQYTPPGLAAGIALTLLGLAGCVVLSLSSPRRRR
jgi:hypothetical protein